MNLADEIEIRRKILVIEEQLDKLIDCVGVLTICVGKREGVDCSRLLHLTTRDRRGVYEKNGRKS